MNNIEALTLLSILFGDINNAPEQYISLTAIHPARDRPSPTRHIKVGNLLEQEEAVSRLLLTNEQFRFGAYVGIATRCAGLTRWQRGEIGDLISLPALFADIDRPPHEVLADLRQFRLPPSCVISSGAGIHAYWLLDSPIQTELRVANSLLRGLQNALHADNVTAAHCMRLPGSCNTKPDRGNAPCTLHAVHPDRRYTILDFDAVLGRVGCIEGSVPIGAEVANPSTLARLSTVTLSPQVVSAVARYFSTHGFRPRGTWLNGPCIYPHRHKHADVHRSFGFNTATGYGYCFVCGTILLKEICAVASICPTAPGGVNSNLARK